MVFPYELIREGPDPVAELFAVHKGPFSYDIPVRAAHDPVAVPLAVYIGPFSYIPVRDPFNYGPIRPAREI